MDDSERLPGEERGRWVLPLNGKGVDGDAVGGKAAAIDRLIAAGFRVPACAVVTASRTMARQVQA